MLPLPRIGGEGRGEGDVFEWRLTVRPLTLTLSPAAGEREPIARTARMTYKRRLDSESRQDVVDHLAVINLQAFAAGDFEAAVVEAQQVQHGGVQVGDVVAVA